MNKKGSLVQRELAARQGRLRDCIQRTVKGPSVEIRLRCRPQVDGN